MKSKFLILSIVLLIFTACNSNKKETQSEVSKEDISRELEFNKPDESHKALNAYLGSWNTTWKIWDKPTEEPTWTTKGNATFQWVMGGRFLQGSYSGNMMNMPYEGLLTIGYDKYQKQYTARWINSFETTITDYRGSAMADAKNNFNGLKLIGKASSCPVDPKNTEYIYEMKFVSPEKMIETTYAKSDSAKQTKVLEITYEKEALQNLSVSQVTVYVKDYVEAIKYYSDKLGFSVTADDDKTIPGFRYLELGYKQNTGTKIVLVKAETEADNKKIGQGTTIVLNTTDFETTYRKMKQNGVHFIGEPEQLAWGKSAVFTDLYGNSFNLMEHIN